MHARRRELVDIVDCAAPAHHLFDCVRVIRRACPKPTHSPHSRAAAAPLATSTATGRLRMNPFDSAAPVVGIVDAWLTHAAASLGASTALFHPHLSTALVHTLTGSCGLRRTHERLQHRWHRRLRNSRQRTRSTCIPDAGNSLASTTALWQRRLRCSTHTRRLRWFIHSQAHTLPHKLAASLKSGECCATLPELVDPAVRQQARTTCMILTIVTICSEWKSA